MNYAIVDVGSNSLRLSIYSCEGGNIKEILTQKEVAGLSQYVKNHLLEEDGIQKTCDILNAFRETACRFTEPSHLHVFATAVLRNIENRAAVLETIAQNTSLQLDVLDGLEEARLDFVGASHFSPYEEGLLIDIGGASTELVHFQAGSPLQSYSLPIGCLSLYTKHVRKVLPTKPERKAIKEDIRMHLDELDWGKTDDIPLLLGVGGTLKAVLKILTVMNPGYVSGASFPATNISVILKKLKHAEGDIIPLIYKAAPDRLLTISPGLLILKEIARKHGCQTVTVSKYGVREGYLIDRVLK